MTAAKKATGKKAKKKTNVKKIKPLKCTSLPGVHDILPGEQSYWQQARKVLSDEAEEYGFGRIDVPIMESESLFRHVHGETSELYEKETYCFKNRSRDDVVLRSDFTPAIARAYTENGMVDLRKPIKLFTIGHAFRHERVQAGRCREFVQANYDIFGEQDPVLDAQVIQIAHRVLQKLGIKNIQFHVNSVGTRESRAHYRELLTAYFESRRTKLPSKYRDMIDTDPMRIFEATDDKTMQVCSGAPQAIDHLDKESRDHFKNLLEYLDELDLPYMIDPALDRGINYYTQTIFEVFVIDKDGTRHALGGGGRYNDLVESLGGEPTPAIGFAFGVDRLVAEMRRLKAKAYMPPEPRVYLAQIGDLAKKKSLRIFSDIESAGILVAESFGRGNLKEQMEQATKMKVDIVVIVGQKEALDGTVILKDMHTGTQETITSDKVVCSVKDALKKTVKVSKIK